MCIHECAPGVIQREKALWLVVRAHSSAQSQLAIPNSADVSNENVEDNQPSSIILGLSPRIANETSYGSLNSAFNGTVVGAAMQNDQSDLYERFMDTDALETQSLCDTRIEARDV